MINLFGFAVATLSSVANGTFPVPSRLEPAKSSGIEPYIFNLYTGLGVFISCLPIPFIFGVHLSFTWLGIVSGFLFSISSMNAFVAINLVGVSIAPGIWCGVAIVVSFFYGYIFEEPVSNFPLALFSIAVLVLSICGIAYAERVASAGEEEAVLLESSENKGPLNLPPRFIKGAIAAVMAGCFGGLILAPENYVPEEARGVAFIPSFGVGVLISSPLINLSPYVVSGEMPQFHVKEAGCLGLLAGMTANIGIVCSMIAIKQIGYSIAYPIMQCGLFVSGLWGILLFNEIRGPAQKYYWLSGGVLISGAIALNLSK